MAYLFYKRGAGDSVTVQNPGPFSASRQGKLPVEVSHTERDRCDSSDALIVAAGREKERVNRALAEYQSATKRMARADLRRRAIQLATHSYLPAVIRVRKGLSTAALTRARDALEERLERGYAMELDPVGERFFVTLLAQYESVCDALSKDALGPILERVDRHELVIGSDA